MLKLNQLLAQGFLKTPPLWYNEQFGIEQFEFPEIDLANFSLKTIPQNIRLGHQMEYVFKQIIEHSDIYTILLHNLPIRDEKRTLGEIDFILKELVTHRLIHIELTYKFYIINPEINEPLHQLIGPNKRDVFFAKMEKIKNKQFNLLHSKQGIQALEKIGFNHEKIVHKTCFKAQLFSPYQSENNNITPFNKACIIGYWLRFDDLNTAEFKSYQYYIPYKSEWVITPHENVQWKSHFKTLIDINLYLLKEKAPMVWMRTSDTEFEKLFVIL